jgi:hypothetical protein
MSIGIGSLSTLNPGATPAEHQMTPIKPEWLDHHVNAGTGYPKVYNSA